MSRYRRTLVAIALAAAGANVLTTAQASPFAGTYRSLQVDFSARGSDGAQYDVTLIATQTVASVPGEQNLYVTITRCTSPNRCKRIQHTKQALKDGEIVIAPDMTTATLRTTVRGVRLNLDATTTYVYPDSNTVTHPGATLYGLETASGGPNPRFDVNVPSTGTVALGVVACSGARAAMFTYQGVDQVGDDVRDPHTGPLATPAALVKGKAKRCS